MRKDSAQATAFKAHVRSDDVLASLLHSANEALESALDAMDMSVHSPPAIVYPRGEDFTFPWNLWRGNIGLKPGHLGATEQSQYSAAKREFLLACGSIRYRVVHLWEIQGAINDLGNATDRPNAGGQAGASP